MSTVFVTLCDPGYFSRAKQTIKDLRSRGNWAGDIVLIGVDCAPPPEFLTEFRVETVSFPRFDVSSYVDKMRQKPLSVPTNDGREIHKTTQWEKLHVFEPYFKRWERVVWVDAGLRILEDVKYFLELPWRGKFLCPDDCKGKDYRFEIALEMKNWPDAIKAIQEKYHVKLDGRYFLNCIWIHDTALPVDVSEFLELLAYPIWRHNEMGVMNAVLNFKRGVWVPFPDCASNGKYLFDWSELNIGGGIQWDRFCALKYPVTIKFE